MSISIPLQAYSDGYSSRVVLKDASPEEIQTREQYDFAVTHLPFQEWLYYHFHWQNGYNACTPGTCDGCHVYTAVHEVAGSLLCGECISPPHEEGSPSRIAAQRSKGEKDAIL